MELRIGNLDLGRGKIMSMKILVTLIIITACVGTAVTGLSAVQHGDNRLRQFKNLQVLPKSINDKDLSKIMIDEFEDGLGVGCGFCHAENKSTHAFDYASDAKPEKEIARAMMRMTIKINKKYFGLKKPMLGEPLLPVNCETCHQGTPNPLQRGQ